MLGTHLKMLTQLTSLHFFKHTNLIVMPWPQLLQSGGCVVLGTHVVPYRGSDLAGRVTVTAGEGRTAGWRVTFHKDCWLEGNIP